MPLPGLKTTPAELAEQRNKAQTKRRRKNHYKSRAEFELGSSSKTLYSEGIGHVDQQLATESDYETERLYQQSQDNDIPYDEISEPVDPAAVRIPKRWRSASTTPPSGMDIGTMDDETYAEWIKSGLYRLGTTVQVGHMNVLLTDQRAMEKKKLQFEAYLREQREKEERRLREKEERREKRRLEEEQENLRRLRALDKQRREKELALQAYDERWKELLLDHLTSSKSAYLSFVDIPWPTFTPPTSSADLTTADIRDFVLSIHSTPEFSDRPLPLKDILRPHFLRFHPDKFEGKIIPLVVDTAQEAVREGVGVVMRTLNDLAESKSDRR